MSEHWINEDYEYEPEPEIELPPESAELKIGLSINAGAIEAAINKHVDDLLETRIRQMVRKRVSDSMKNLLSSERWSDQKIDRILYKAVNDRLDAKYPEVVTDKVNEFYEALMAVKYSEGRHDNSIDTLRNKATQKVNEYIENDLKESVAKSKEYIEQFAKNYFANNLFRAMGMMDKLLPQTENSATNK